MFVRFMVMNAGFGNRESGFQNYAVTLPAGRVVLCPICTDESNNEVHSLVVCKGYLLIINIVRNLNNSHIGLKG